MFRNLIGSYLGAEPSMGIALTHSVKGTKTILEANLKGEKEAIDFYKEIYKEVITRKDDLKYEFETLEHEIRHIIIDEQEHVAELSLLLEI
jgi:bacterioferritin (cytochrome b1)